MNFRSEVPEVLCLRWYHVHSKSSSIKKELLDNEPGQYSEHKYSSLLATRDVLQAEHTNSVLFKTNRSSLVITATFVAVAS